MRPAHLSAQEFKGEKKYNYLAASTDEFADFYVIEDLLTGFIKNSSFGDTIECKSALNGMVYYGFEIIKHREVWRPSNAAKVPIAYDGFSKQQALFYK